MVSHISSLQRCLKAHASEKRPRGRWKFACREVLLSGLIPPVTAALSESFAKKCGADRLEAQRRGSTQPVVGHKRALNNHPRLPQTRIPRLRSKRSSQAPEKVFALRQVFNADGTLVSNKRLRTKTSVQESIQHAFASLVKRARTSRAQNAAAD